MPQADSRQPTADSQSDPFDESFLHRLEQLRLVTQRAAGSRLEGTRLGREKGGLIEFRDYRNYAAGDDLRYVDWNLYARIEKLFIKEFAREQASNVTVLVDASASMAAGVPPKYVFCVRLAAALAYVGLASEDAVRVGTIREGSVNALPPRTGTGAIYEVLDFYRKAAPSGRTGLISALKSLAGSARERGTIILLSDFWDDSPHPTPHTSRPTRDAPLPRPDLLAAIRTLGSRGHELVNIHVLAREEIEPPPAGPFELTDSETGEKLDITLTDAARDAYRAAVSEFVQQLETHAVRFGLRALHFLSDQPFEEGVIEYLRKRRVVR